MIAMTEEKLGPISLLVNSVGIGAPWFKRIFDDDRDASSRPGENLVLYLASGEADALSGRYFAAPGAPDNVV